MRFFKSFFPVTYRPQVLASAHGNSVTRPWIFKTYNHVLRYFFWPGLKATVVKHCRSCHIFQVTGKPNQVVPLAPLCPIPRIGEAFQHVIVDCVGLVNSFYSQLCVLRLDFRKLLPYTQSLQKFFATFRFPKIIQTDHGSISLETF